MANPEHLISYVRSRADVRDIAEEDFDEDMVVMTIRSTEVTLSASDLPSGWNFGGFNKPSEDAPGAMVFVSDAALED